MWSSKGCAQSTTGGSLSSTPPALAGAYTGPPSTRHPGAFDPVFALGSFINKEFRNQYRGETEIMDFHNYGFFNQQLTHKRLYT